MEKTNRHLHSCKSEHQALKDCARAPGNARELQTGTWAARQARPSNLFGNYFCPHRLYFLYTRNGRSLPGPGGWISSFILHCMWCPCVVFAISSSNIYPSGGGRNDVCLFFFFFHLFLPFLRILELDLILRDRKMCQRSVEISRW